MSINIPKNPEKREEARGQKPQTPIEKQISDTKKKAHEAQYGKK